MKMDGVGLWAADSSQCKKIYEVYVWLWIEMDEKMWSNVDFVHEKLFKVIYKIGTFAASEKSLKLDSC